MGGGFSDVDQEQCQHYARFLSHLDRYHFDLLYWISFVVVIALLFLASWIFQWTMMCKDKPNYTDERFKKKLILAIALTTAIFLMAGVLCVIEVYALMALQFCDGEDLTSLFWSTWTMLQLGSEIAILGVMLALWHQLYNVRHPAWALAMGTPVLVVAGFGHVLSFAFEKCWKRHKAWRKDRKRERKLSRGTNSPIMEDEKPGDTSSAQSMGRAQESSSEETIENPSALEMGQNVYFTLDVGNDDARIKTWPAFVGMNTDGKAILQLTAMSSQQQPPRAGGSGSRDIEKAGD